MSINTFKNFHIGTHDFLDKLIVKELSVSTDLNVGADLSVTNDVLVGNDLEVGGLTNIINLVSTGTISATGNISSSAGNISTVAGYVISDKNTTGFLGCLNGPVVASDPIAGSTVSVELGSTDMYGIINIDDVAHISGINQNICKITFNTAFPLAPIVVISPLNSASKEVVIFVNDITTTSFSLFANTGVIVSTDFKFNFICIGGIV